jgi:hypothetical protein
MQYQTNYQRRAALLVGMVRATATGQTEKHIKIHPSRSSTARDPISYFSCPLFFSALHGGWGMAGFGCLPSP